MNLLIKGVAKKVINTTLLYLFLFIQYLKILLKNKELIFVAIEEYGNGITSGENKDKFLSILV